MVGWLTHGEWCDVRLLCRGGVLSAHRAVLASASPYLRCILISHTEETPIYIALPDIDWEAMSPVLYYVYNGEINVPVEKLTSFFEIINTLQIFIDKGILEKVKEYFKENDEEMFNKMMQYNVEGKFHNSSIEIEDVSNKYIKLEYKSTSSEETNRQNPDIQIFSQNALDLFSRQNNISYLNIIQDKDVDLLENSPLRDPLTETYSPNGIANRPSPNVPTITNERNLHLLSGGVMNGNNNIMDTTKLESVTATNIIINDMLKRYQRYNINNQELQKSLTMTTQDIKLLKNMLSVGKSLPNRSEGLNRFSRTNELRPVPTLVPLNKCQPDLLDLSTIMRHEKHDLNKTNLVSNINTWEECRRNRKEDKQLNFKTKVKRSPLNQVLAGPWIPRQPKSYRPFKIRRRQSPENSNKKSSEVVTSDDESSSSNDKNNNLLDIPNETKSDEETAFDEPTYSKRRDSISAEISSNEEVSEDSKKHTSRARHTCGECGKSFSQLRNYKYHLSVHRGTKEFAATCTVCGKYFNDRGYLSSHMKIHRNQKEYQCSHCPKSFNQRVAYNMHIRIHTGIKPHVCDECGKAFSRKMLLKQHQRTHSGERPYACSFCDKRFADRSNMTLHMRLHSGVKPFSCTLCPKSFTKKHHLKTHLNFHTGAKPYACPRCHVGFSQSSNMRTHLKKCSTEASTT